MTKYGFFDFFEKLCNTINVVLMYKTKIMDLYRPAYCEDIDYVKGTESEDSPNYDHDCEVGLVKPNEYYDGEYTPDHTDISYEAEHTLSPEEEAKLVAQANAAQREAREREEELTQEEMNLDGAFDG